MASLEGSPLTVEQDVTQGGFAFSSGLASAGTALELLDAGATVIAGDDMYGGSYRLLSLVRARSQGLNVVYVDTTDPANVEKAFVEQAGAEGMSGLKGHRSVGGIRASIYNAFPAAGCDTLASFMADFASKNG